MILVSVIHVLGSINFIVFSLAISDVEQVRSGLTSVLSQVSADKGTVSLSGIVVESLGISGSGGKYGKESPAVCHTFEVRHSDYSLNTKINGEVVGQIGVALVSVPQSLHGETVLGAHVVGQKIRLGSVISEFVVFLKTIILGHEFLEPGTTGDLISTSKVAKSVKLIQHI